MRRAWIAWIAWIASACIFSAGCNGLLRNVEHDVIADASIASGADDASSGALDASWTSDAIANGQDAKTSCTDLCAAGATRCNGNGVETCLTSASGCFAWSAAIDCTAGTTCTGGQCAGPCSLDGATQCSGNAVQTCTNGQWGNATPCTSQTCKSGACVGACTSGETSAIPCGHCGTNARTCNASGAWVDGTCTGEGACAPNATLTCNTSGTQTCSATCTWGPCSCGPGCIPSCATGGPGMTDCGSGSVNCCSSLLVTAGTYARTYDGLSFTDNSNSATVTAFRLDRYEVTVGRFRPFVAAMTSGFMPAAGAGKHVHLSLGQGLNATGGGHEPGWVASWNGNLATTTSAWNTKLATGTWTPAPGSNERLPITGISWYDAYAFCIWDGGFLPSDAEWNYAAAGGVEQRAYPWSPAFPPGSNAISCGNAWYSGCSSATTPAGAPIPVGGLSPGGDGRWGQADLAGNVYEWVLDWSATYVNPCNDCVNLTPIANIGKVIRGGSVTSSSFQVLAGARGSAYVAGSFPDIGVRCARAM